MQEAALPGICSTVIYFLAVTAADDQSAGLQRPEMVGDSGAGHFQQGRNIQDTLLLMAQEPEDADSGSVANLFEDVCYGLEVIYAAELFSDSGSVWAFAMMMG